MPDNPTCATCRWWDKVNNDAKALGMDEYGFCHRAPPCRSRGESMFPPVPSWAWCGEHAPIVKEPRCWLHPDRITDGNLLFGRHLCGECWMEWMVAEQEGATPAFRAKFFKATPKDTPKDTPDAPR